MKYQLKAYCDCHNTLTKDLSTGDDTLTEDLQIGDKTITVDLLIEATKELLTSTITKPS